MAGYDEERGLILAAEDCPPELFDSYHKFSAHDFAIIRKLVAHGPILIRGGRGCGKSALMIAAYRKLKVEDDSAFGVYLSLRHLPLLRSTGADYEKFFLTLLIESVANASARFGFDFSPEADTHSVRTALNDLASSIGKRIVILFDDAAHIGREASLQEFFDLFRTLSSSLISCKASIYPGVTRFGARFDVYNDATVVDVARSDEDPGFQELFADVARARFPSVVNVVKVSKSMSQEDFFGFVGQSVLGNMRGFVYAMNAVERVSDERIVGLPLLGRVLKELSSNYYWPLLDELRPKLGGYEDMLVASTDVAEVVFEKCGGLESNYALIHRDVVSKFSKALEILEYAGFIARRDVSMAMKSGGRGARYSLNLCGLLESVPGSRITQGLFDYWVGGADYVEFHRGGSDFSEVVVPEVRENADLGVLGMGIDNLLRSNAYPYGLSEQKISVLEKAGYKTIGLLAEASEEDLMSLYSVGEVMAKRIKFVAHQAIWM
ncbi:hypothetical protein [Luteimonas abyssi]|uniref:hypothetical protein n=1 Tax=Luteimonas abyssi TaxID=1247514 RepID=UPI000AA3CA7F|nr:hypothetical protein [Luteimonas abyssi]